MYPASVTFVAALVAGVLTAVALAVWPWARTRGRFAAAGVATLGCDDTRRLRLRDSIHNEEYATLYKCQERHS